MLGKKQIANRLAERQSESSWFQKDVNTVKPYRLLVSMPTFSG